MRRRIAQLLTVIFLLSTISLSLTPVNVSAASKAEEVIKALGIMNTDKGDSSKGSNNVSRSQYAQMLVNLSSQKDKLPNGSNVSMFSDVTKKHWAARYIRMAVEQEWMSGYLNGTFKPDKAITLQEALNGVLRLLGYTKSDFTGNITGAQMALFKSKGLNKNIKKTNSTAELTVNDCINLFYNTLNAKMKDGKVYAETLGYKLNANGELDYLSLVNAETQGPVIVDSNWKDEIPFAVNQAIYYRNGVKCSISDISDYDVLYYCVTLNTIWAYDNKVTGTVQSIKPNNLSPTSVIISGKEYTLDGSEVSLAFSTLGDISEGDFVTLLLGKDGTAVGVINTDEFNTTITGVVLETGQHLVTDADGNYINSSYVNFVDASGNLNQQDYNSSAINFSVGDLVRVTFEDGKATVSKYDLLYDSFGGYNFNIAGTMLGMTKLASNVKILDLKGKNYISVTTKRLAGATIGEFQVCYYELNGKGEITQLILNNVTGDMDKYGILGKIDFSMASGKTVYNYIIDGTAGTFSPNSLENFDTNIGPKGFTFEGNTLKGTFALHGVTVTAIGKTTIQDKDTKYLLADEYDVYYLINGEYVPTTIDKVSDLTKYSLKAYYDKSDLFGGRIRIIVAESIK